MKTINLFVAIGLVALSSVISSCNKDDDTTEISNTDITDVQDNATASNAFDDVDIEVNSSYGNSLKSDIATIDTTNKPVVKIVSKEKGKIVKEFNYDGVTRRGKVRSGKIIVTITYPIVGDSSDETKWVKTVTFDNYTIGQRKLEGTKIIKYLGKIDGVHPQWDVTLTDGKITLKNGKTITLNYNRTRLQIEGYLTPFNIVDDVYKINGTGTGVKRNGKTYTSTLVDIIVKVTCKYITSGTETFVSENKTKIITYTAGDDCSPSATVLVNGKSKSITIENEAE